jgi:hypothetical protein
MKFRGFLMTFAAALVCCCTLGCPPAEDEAGMGGASDAAEPAEDSADMTPAADDNTTE